MIEYFKHTNGSAFTLSGSDFTGVFNVINGEAWTGKSFSSTSVRLSSKDTFLANCFLAQIEFDRTASPLNESHLLTKTEISPRNVIDQVFIDTNLGILNANNLNLYSLNIIANSSLLNFRDDYSDGNAFFLGLSSGKHDLRNDDVSLPKHNLFPIQIDPFSFIDKVPGLDVLDDTVDSTLFVYEDDSYQYLISTSDSRSYSFSGTFTDGGSITRLNYESNIFGKNAKFTYDNNTDTLYSLIPMGEDIEGTAAGFTLKLYDNSFVQPCNALKLVDQIEILDPVLDDVIQVGNELKGYRYMEEAGTGEVGPGECYAPGDKVSIRLSNKYSNTHVGDITPGDTGEVIVAFDIRDTDDSILVLTLMNMESMVGDIFKLYHIDAENITGLSPDLNPKVVQRFEAGAFPGKECQIEIYFSKIDSNMFTLVDEGFISTRFISNPEYVAGFANPDDLMYLPTMYFGGTNERFDLIQKKFNSNTLKSNYFNYINFLVANNSTDLFYFLHTIGRIYLFKADNDYNNFVPLDLPHAYKKITSCESSLGISLNSEIQNIIEDTVNIFLNLSIVPIATLVQDIPVLADYVTFESPADGINFRNFEFHENEEVSYSAVSRVFNQLYALQKAILDSIMRQGLTQDEVTGRWGQVNEIDDLSFLLDEDPEISGSQDPEIDPIVSGEWTWDATTRLWGRINPLTNRLQWLPPGGCFSPGFVPGVSPGEEICAPDAPTEDE